MDYRLAIVLTLVFDGLTILVLGLFVIALARARRLLPRRVIRAKASH